MAPNLLLHVGLPKTGTSSIQRFLFDNKQFLLEQGFYIPTFLQRNELRGAVHAWTSLLAFDETRIEPLVIDFGMQDTVKRRAMRKDKWEQINNAMNTYPEHTWIVSDEILTARMTNQQDLESLRDNFINLFADCKVIFFLRNQLESAIGQWSTDLINGSVQKEMAPPSDLPEDPQRYLHHQSLLTLWHSCMPDLEFIVKLYDKNRLLDVFADIAGIDTSQMAYASFRENSSIPACCLGLLARYNERRPFLEASRPPSEMRRYIPLALSRAFYGYPAFRPDAKIRKAYNEYYAESDEWVRSTYFPEFTHLWNEEDIPPELEPSSFVLGRDLETSILNLFEDYTLHHQNADEKSFGKKLMRKLRLLKQDHDLETSILNLLEDDAMLLSNGVKKSFGKMLTSRLLLLKQGLRSKRNIVLDWVKATVLRS